MRNRPHLISIKMLSVNKSRLILISLILLFVLLRWAMLVNFNGIFFGEELYRGTIARELIHGLRMPFFNYRADDYSGGSLVMGIIIVPFFILFGENLFALKLAALTLFLLSLILLYLFCEKFFNRRVAAITGLLFILSPKSFSIYSFVAMGFHSESILFSIILVFLFFQIFYSQRTNFIYFFLLGLAAGFGLWFTYIFAITLISCFLFWFSFDRKFIIKKTFCIFLFGFLIGFSPWLWFNFTHNFKGLDIIKVFLDFKAALGGNGIYPANRFKDAIRELIDKTGAGWDRIVLLNILYFLIFFIAFCFLLWKERGSISKFIFNIFSGRNHKVFNLKETKYSFFLVYPLVFGLIFFFTNIAGYGRYLIPLFPFIFLIIGFFLGRIWDNKIKKVRISVIIITILISIGIINQASFFLNHDRFGKGFKVRGYSYFALAHTLCGNDKYYFLDRPMPKYWGSLIARFDAEEKKDFYQGLWLEMIEAGFTVGQENLAKCIETISQQIDKNYQNYFYYKLGERIADTFPDKEEGARVINAINNEHKQVIRQGFDQTIEYIEKFQKPSRKL